MSNAKLKKDYPTYCPHCKTPYWNRKRIKDMNKKEKEIYRLNKKNYRKKYKETIIQNVILRL